MYPIKYIEENNKYLKRRIIDIETRNQKIRDEIEKIDGPFSQYPTRRVFTIDVSNLPKGKAEEYIRKLMKKYKKRNGYGPLTSTEDYYFT